MKMAKSVFLIIVLLYIIIPFVQSEGDARINYENDEAIFESGDYTKETNNCNNYEEAFSYFQKGFYEECDQICDQALRDSSSIPRCLDKFFILGGKAAIAFEKGGGIILNAGGQKRKSVPKGYIKGMNYYDEAIKLNPNSTIAWNQKGRALAELGDYSESIFCFEEVILINSSQAVAYNNKGASFDNMGNHTQALRCYDDAIKLDPILAEAWYNKAKTLALDQNNISKAKECYREAVRIKINLALKCELLMWLYADLEIWPKTNELKGPIKEQKDTQKCIIDDMSDSSSWKPFGDRLSPKLSTVNESNDTAIRIDYDLDEQGDFSGMYRDILPKELKGTTAINLSYSTSEDPKIIEIKLEDTDKSDLFVKSFDEKSRVDDSGILEVQYRDTKCISSKGACSDNKFSTDRIKRITIVVARKAGPVKGWLIIREIQGCNKTLI